MKDECSIVKDLLPLHVDDLCSGATTEFINTHMGQCPQCKHTYEVLLSEIQLNNKDLLKAKEPFALIKRKNRRKNAILLSSFLIVIIIMASVVYYCNKIYNVGFLGTESTMAIASVVQVSNTSFEIEINPAENYIIKSLSYGRETGNVFLSVYVTKKPPISFTEKALMVPKQVQDFSFSPGLTDKDEVTKIYLVTDPLGNKDAPLIWSKD